MRTETHSITQLKRAKRYVKRLKSWYWFIPMNVTVTAFFCAISYLMFQNEEPNTVIWILMSCPIGLWIIFIGEGIVLKKPRTIRSWEEQRIKKYIKQDKTETY